EGSSMKHWLHKNICIIATAVVCCGLSVRPAVAATPKQVDDAIKRGKEYVYSQMKGDNWESVPPPNFAGGKGGDQSNPNERQWGGTSALAVYMLLAAGEN